MPTTNEIEQHIGSSLLLMEQIKTELLDAWKVLGVPGFSTHAEISPLVMRLGLAKCYGDNLRYQLNELFGTVADMSMHIKENEAKMQREREHRARTANQRPEPQRLKCACGQYGGTTHNPQCSITGVVTESNIIL